jgi:ATP/maltotriose-dependent transcriptional regulator MalT
MAARLEAELIAAARLDYALRPRVPERLARLERLGSGDPIGRAIAGCQRAYELTLAGEHHARPVAMAREALGDGELLDALGPEDPSLHTGINALALNERLEEAESAFDAVIDATRERGSSVGFAIASCFRSQVHLRRGDVRRAEADARASVEVSAEEGWGLGIPAARAFLVYALLERGELDDAERTLEEAGLGDEIPELVMFDPVLECRGRLRIARGEGAAGVEDLLACGRRQERWGAHNPSVIPWRSMAAEAMLRIGRAEEALSLVEEEVALAEATGLPRATGMALRVAGLARGERETLEAAVAMLERSGTLTELARARIALGGLLRRDGQRAAAREELRLALDHADRAGAEAIAQVAREELLAAGARPRRARLSGREALTASELRVAAEAARGVSNREIAQSLFITVKTVETHLSNTYGKLGISSRSELAEALGEDG